MCFIWTHLAPSVLWDTCWVRGIFLIFIDLGKGRNFHTGLSLGRVGFHGSQAGNISSRMLCLSEASFLFSALTNTLLSIRRAVTLPLLTDPHSPFLFCHLFVPSLFPPSPTSPQSISGTSQLSSMTLANQTDSSGLMRLLGVAFPGEKDKQEWEREQEEARRRDHRRIGTVRGKSKLDEVHKMRSFYKVTRKWWKKYFPIVNTMCPCLCIGPGSVLL